MSELNDLKAKAYDLIGNIERAKMMLDQINQQIRELSSKKDNEDSPKKED